jgi:hypothetical protein
MIPIPFFATTSLSLDCTDPVDQSGEYRWVWWECAESWMLQETIVVHGLREGGPQKIERHRGHVRRLRFDDTYRWAPYDANGQAITDPFDSLHNARGHLEFCLRIGPQPVE